jgi:U6 snRNA-associated Sm-like protein LSm7
VITYGYITLNGLLSLSLSVPYSQQQQQRDKKEKKMATSTIAATSTTSQKKAREQILDLDKHIDRDIIIKFNGGREVVGTLKGFDQMLNIVLDNAKEYIHDEEDKYKRKLVEQGNEMLQVTRKLGVVVCRGTSIMYVCPLQGTAQIENPFVGEEEEQEEEEEQ